MNAAKISGILKIKENLAASFLSRRVYIDAVNVLPDLETPGKIARA